MMGEGQLTSVKLKPFWARVALVDSPLDEDETVSGIVLPIKGDDFNRDEAYRAAVVAIDDVWDEATPGRAIMEQLKPGMIVYYRGGIKIRGMVFVNCQEIIAFEEG